MAQVFNVYRDESCHLEHNGKGLDLSAMLRWIIRRYTIFLSLECRLLKVE